MIGEAWTTARVFDSNITAGETVMGFDTEKKDSSDDDDDDDDDTVIGAVATLKKSSGSTTARSGDAGIS